MIFISVLFPLCLGQMVRCLLTLFVVLSSFSLSGIPRHIDSQEEYSRREPKQLKRESSPSPRGPDSIKSPRLVSTVKEAGPSIHLIPPEGVLMSKAPKEGSITQVTRTCIWL